MPDQQPDIVEVQKTVEKKGKVRFNLQQIGNPTPVLAKRICTAARYFIVSLIGLISASDLFTGGQAKLLIFCGTVLIFLIGAIEICIGLEPAETKK